MDPIMDPKSAQNRSKRGQKGPYLAKIGQKSGPEMGPKMVRNETPIIPQIGR